MREQTLERRDIRHALKGYAALSWGHLMTLIRRTADGVSNPSKLDAIRKQAKARPKASSAVRGVRVGLILLIL